MEKAEITKFRLTIGENGTPYGKQEILHTGEAANAIEFVKSYLENRDPSWISHIINSAWVDAGYGTLPIDVKNLKLA